MRANNPNLKLRKEGVIMQYPETYRYTKSHQWLVLEGRTVHVGITDYAQDTLGEIKFLELPSLDQTVEAEAPFGSIESVKSVSELLCPVSGQVIAVNETLTANPEILNKSANDTWIVKVAMTGTIIGETLSAAEYEQFIAAEPAV
jgi:glycine cleavage system H protein